MPNELQRGVRRTGDFYDSYPDTPEVKVTLERSDEGIGVTVAWSGPDVPYARWFLRGGGFIAGTEPKDARPVPRRVVFQDSHGAVLLIRCWAHGYHANALGPGSGTLWAKAAIMGVHADLEFDRPQGLQSEVSGLREWLGVTSWDEDYDRRAPTSVVLRSVVVMPIEVGTFSGMELTLWPTWQVVPEEGRDRRVLLDLVRCITRSADPLDWDVHMNLHRAIRDLLVLSRWRDESCVPVYALRADDPLTTMDGEVHGEQWREVVVGDDERTPPPIGWHGHLVTFHELGVGGLGRWIALREEFARALDPVISSLGLRNTTPHTRLAHTGPGLEALGFLLLLRDGQSERAAGSATLKTRFARILADVPDCLPFDGGEWASRTIDTYNGLKHANRAKPDDIDVMHAWAESVMVMRAWVALELGVSPDIVKSRLEDDRQPRRFERIL
ncbi:HEPN domain-containing protein [Agromyces seonyuensis]|uniref:Reverse gyrase n=1 Tax=Agromyces seonyuensis TaxID=2662446 RepID=A0A6I4P0K6_9MICO|nr:HEPN domain-containing protein [Agromyces seonyuensis]MWB99032.1 reverse gyrase [Agromyces seonyuensis]